MTAARTTAAIALGSNLGDRDSNLRGAIRSLERTAGVTVLRRSTWIETEPEGGPDGQGSYLNGAALVETTLSPRALVAELQRIEAKYGRERGVVNGPRTLDLDLLWHGEVSVDEPGLVVPHPRMEERLFVLEPLGELVPGFVLPFCRRTVADRVLELRAGRAQNAPDPSGPAPAAGEGPLRAFGSPAEAKQWCAGIRAQGANLGFVATMGALHDGHLALVRRSVEENDVTCASVFVNPLQFDDAGDLENYPRDFDGDAARLESVGCDMVFTGTLEGFFPGELVDGVLPRERRLDPGPAAAGLEGEYRTGHFDGVATIVDRLFDVVEPTRAYFGQKDFQQSLVVSDVAARRGGPEVIVCPTVREPSGLAMSSRNLLLDESGRQRGLALSRSLRAARSAWRDGERNARALEAAMRTELEGVEVDYAGVRDPEAWTVETPGGELERAVALVAGHVGRVRLIDNLLLAPEDPSLP